MKGYYLFSPEEKEHAKKTSGVYRKVIAQTKSLNMYLSCSLYFMQPVEYCGSIKEKFIRRLPLTAAWRKWDYKGEFDSADFLYIRQVYHDASFTRYLRKIKKNNPSIRIVYEIPTYPYDDETIITINNLPFVLKERIARRIAAKYFDRIVTFYNQDKIWCTQCIKIINGFDFSEVILPKREISDVVHIMSVSSTAFWHGYDRVIEGLHEYYLHGGNDKIIYHLVGSILPEHVQAVNLHGLQSHVIFHGELFGVQLKEIFKICFIGVDILGGHRKNYPISSSLKSREYAANGLPVITSSPIDYLPTDYPYQLVVPYDDSPLDFNCILEFYHRIYDKKDCNEVANEIRSFANARCDMSITMKPIADWLLNKEV